MKVPILAGLYADSSAEMRTGYPRNLVPVPKQTGINDGYLKPAEGVIQTGTGPGAGRGGINWRGALYRVLGDQFCSIDASGVVTSLGRVGGTGQVSLDYSFDRLAIASGGTLFYWDGSKLTAVTDGNIGTVIDVKWLAGYFVCTDGVNVVVTNLNDPTTGSPLGYGSAEGDPNPVKAVDSLRGELYVFTRYSIQVFRNVGAQVSLSTVQSFPFQAINEAEVPKGAIGTYAYTPVGDTFYFLGSGRGEAPAVYKMVPANTEKVSTREIDRILLNYTEAQLSKVVLEVRVDRNHQLVYMHLPDQTWVFDTIGSLIVGEFVWYQLDSGLLTITTYRARNLVWCYDQWNVEDPTTPALGVLTDTVSSHYGSVVGWEVTTPILYNEGNDAEVHELELVTLPGRVPIGADPSVWTQYSTDGETWSLERVAKAGRPGQRNKRIGWRQQGRIRHYRMQRVRGTSDAHLPILRLEAKVEPLNTRPGNV